MSKPRPPKTLRDDFVTRILNKAELAEFPSGLIEAMLGISRATLWRWRNPRLAATPDLNALQRDVLARLEQLLTMRGDLVRNVESFATAGPVTGIAALFIATTPNPKWLADLVVRTKEA